MTDHHVKPGTYRHFKGGEYTVIGTACHSETGEEFVVYCDSLVGAMWIRPLHLFVDLVLVGESVMPRFEYLGE